MLSNENCRANFDAGTLLLRSETHDLTCIRNSAPATEVCEPLHLCLQERSAHGTGHGLPLVRGALAYPICTIMCKPYDARRISGWVIAIVAYNVVSVRPIGLVNVRISYPQQKSRSTWIPEKNWEPNKMVDFPWEIHWFLDVFGHRLLVKLVKPGCSMAGIKTNDHSSVLSALDAWKSCPP